MPNTDNLLGLAEELRIIADEISYQSVSDDDEYYTRGTILKALPNQNRFKPKSMWVSLGGGLYKHLTGSKGLVAKHERLDGYTEVVFQ